MGKEGGLLLYRRRNDVCVKQVAPSDAAGRQIDAI